MDSSQWGKGGGAPATDFSFLSNLVSGSEKKKSSGLLGLGANALGDVFKVLSVPLHAVTATGVTAGRTVGSFYGQQYDQGPSLGNWWNMVADPNKAVDFGDIVSGNPEKGLTYGVYKGKSAPKGSLLNFNAPTPVRIATGLAGDVALDPLTFVMPAGDIHGAAEAAGHIAEAAGQQIAEVSGRKLSPEIIGQILTKAKPVDELVKTSPEVALKIEEIRTAAQDAVHAARRGGASALTAEQLDRFGTVSGPLGNRTLEKGLQLDFGRLGHINLTNGEGVTGQLSVLRHKAQMQLGDMILGREGVARGLGKLNGSPELNAIARSGSARRVGEEMSMLDATVFKRLRSTTRAMTEAAANGAARESARAVKGFTSEEIQAAHELIDTGGEAAASAPERVQELAQRLSDAQRKHAEKLVKAGVLSPDDLLQEGTYFPSPITKDAREALVASGLHPEQGGEINNARAFVEGKRKLWDPATGVGVVGQDTETSQRITFTAKTRAEAEVKASKIVAEQLKAAAEGGSEAAQNFLSTHPEAIDLMEQGKYPLFQEGREALQSQARAIGRRVGQAYAGRKLFEQGYGLVDPNYAKGFVDYGPTAEMVLRMKRLGEEAITKGRDQEAKAAEMRLTAEEMHARDINPPPEAPPEAGGISPESPPEGPVSPAAPAAPTPTTPVPTARQAAAAEDVAAAGRDAAVELEKLGTVEEWYMPHNNRRLDELIFALDRQPLTDAEKATLDEVAAMREAGTFYPMPDEVLRHQVDMGDFQHMGVADARQAEQLHEEMQQMAHKYLGAKNSYAPVPKAVQATRIAQAQTVTDAEVVKNMNAVEQTVDDLRSYMRDRTVHKGSTAIGKIDELKVTDHEDALDGFIKKLELQEPSTFGYRDPLEALSPEGFTPTGGNLKGTSVFERITAKEKLLRAQVEDFKAHPDVYAAKVRARAEGRLLEDANKAKVGLAADPTNAGTHLVPEPRRAWTAEERAGHRDAIVTVKALGADRGAALQDVRKAEAEVRAITARGAQPVEQHTANTERDLMLLQKERDELAKGLQIKQEMDATDAAATAEQRAYESPVGGTEDLSGGNIEQWAARNTVQPEGELTGPQRAEFDRQMARWLESKHLPLEDSDAAQYARETRQGLTTAHPRPELMTDKMVDLLVQRQLEILDRGIERLNTVSNIHAPGEVRLGPVTDLDLAERRAADARARVSEIDGQIETAKAGLPPDRSTKYTAPPSGKLVAEPIEGSAYEKALKDLHGEIAKANARAVEPHLESREQWAIGDTPYRDIETGDLIKEGTLQGAVANIDPTVVKARADKIMADWERLGRTANDHEQMRNAWEGYHGELGKKLKPTVENAMVAKASHQVDQLGRLAQTPAAVSSLADDIVADGQAVADVSTNVIPDQVRVNVEQRAADAPILQKMSEDARAAGENAKAEIAHMRLIADHFANDAEMYRGNAREWLSEWNSITDERKMHDAVGSLLVQGEFDWLKNTSLQRGILTPRSAADAVQYAEKLATPEGSHLLAESWRKALHWMRVWQITSPGFHIRNLFGGIFNNALAGVDLSTYQEFGALWRKAAKNPDSLTREERTAWNYITSVQTPGQIGSESLGSPMGRLAGESGISKTPWGQLGTHGALPRVSENAGSNVEFYLRGSLMYDTLKKGGTLDDAVEAVNKFHFDYHDSSATEQWIKANAVPFLTWTRHNVPLQLQMLVENPRPYARFAHFKANVESQSQADKVVPGYFADISAIRLPWSSGGGHNYYIPDLPFRDLGLVSDPIQELTAGKGDLGDRALAAFGEPIASTTPLISGPIEWMLGKQFYKGIPLRDDRGIKLHDLHIPEWLATPLRLTPLVKQSKNGQSYITERDFYVIEKMLPVLARARRLGGSSEKKQQDKFMSHLVSFFAGTQVRTNNLDDQKIANYISSLETKRQKTINNGIIKG